MSAGKLILMASIDGKPGLLIKPDSIVIPDTNIENLRKVIESTSPSQMHGLDNFTMSNELKQNLRNELIILKGAILKKKEAFQMQNDQLQQMVAHFLQQADFKSAPPPPAPIEPKQIPKVVSTPSTPSKSRANRSSTTTRLVSKRSAGSSSRRNRGSEEQYLDVWTLSNSCFSELPSEEALSPLFEVMEPKKSTEFQIEEHWSLKIRRAYISTQRILGTKAQKIEPPPGPPPLPTDVSDEWKTKSVAFQIEESQKQNRGLLQCLLSSLVELDTSSLIDISSKPFIPVHSLIPKLNYGGYSEITFEQRLGLELESANLEKTELHEADQRNAFEAEISTLTSELNSLKPKIEQMKGIFQNEIIKYREEERRRIETQNSFDQLFDEAKRRGRKAFRS